MKPKIDSPNQKTKKRVSKKKLIDDFLLKISPQVQKQIDQLKGAMENNPARVETMKVLGLKILERAKGFSQALKAEKKAKKSTEKSRPQAKEKKKK